MFNISIVIYKNDFDSLINNINSFIDSNLIKKLFIIDNSPNDDLKKIKNINIKIEYIFNPSNPGYGVSHNIAIRKSINSSIKYHIVLNPDVYCKKDVLEELYDFMERNKDIGLVMPQVLYNDDSIQYLCKLLPYPIDLFGRRFLDFWPFKKIMKKRKELYELRFTKYDSIMEPPYLSGCFMFLRVDALKKVGIFDERFFMYLEDTDLSRRIHKKYKTVFYPKVFIYHDYAKGSYKNFKLLKYHMQSTIKYFNKWGWFFDEERKKMNDEFLKNFKNERIKLN